MILIMLTITSCLIFLPFSFLSYTACQIFFSCSRLSADAYQFIFSYLFCLLFSLACICLFLSVFYFVVRRQTDKDLMMLKPLTNNQTIQRNSLVAIYSVHNAL